MNKISPKLQTQIGLSIYIIIVGILTLLFKILFGHIPWAIIQVGLLGALVIPNAIYFFSNASAPTKRMVMFMYIIAPGFFLPNIDVRLRVSLILIVLIIINTSIYLSKKKQPISGQS